jgi:hypothetical protein
MSPSAKGANPAPITFGRDQWEAVTGIPIQTADRLVALGLIPSFKVGRRRFFRHADLQAIFAKLAEGGENLLKPSKSVRRTK